MNRALELKPRALTAIVAVTLVGIGAFVWPLVLGFSAADSGHDRDAPWVFLIMLPLLLLVVAAEIADGGMDAKAVATARCAVGSVRGAAADHRRRQRRAADVLPARPCRARVRARVRLRARQRRDVRVRGIDRWRRPVAAVPDARRRMGRDVRRLSAPPARAGRIGAARGVRLRGRRRIRVCAQPVVLAVRHDR